MVSRTPAIHAVDPSPKLEAAFRRIRAERMEGLPILNPALDVEAIGFERVDGHWLGVLVTPWFLDLVRVPGADTGWTSAPGGKRSFVRLPGAEFAFLTAHEPEVGEFQTCSLISPMAGYADQATARETARLALALARSTAGDGKETGVRTDPPGNAPPAPARLVPRTGPASPARRRALLGRSGTAR